MKRLFYFFPFAIGLLAIAPMARAISPYISIRSQGDNGALQKIGWVNAPSEKKVLFGDASFTAEYKDTLKKDTLTHALFGCNSTDNCTTLAITGSSVPGKSANDLLANWFYLASNYQGTLYVSPRIQQFVATPQFSFSTDELVPGLYLTLRAPLAWSKWDLNPIFFTTDDGEPGVNMLDDAETFFCSNITSFNLTSTLRSLSCARFGCVQCDQSSGLSTTRLTDVQADLGYNFFIDDESTIGLYAHLGIPCGSRPRATWLFEPIVGNGHHTTLGFGVTADAVLLLVDKDKNEQWSLHIDALCSHLFGARQNRVFDLKNKPLSRYMTAAHFVDDVASEYAPIANLTSCSVKVSSALQTDIVALVNYTRRGWSCELGYNFWFRSCEKISCDSCAKESCECTDACGQCLLKNGAKNWGISLLGSNATQSASTIYELANNDSSLIYLTDNDIDYDGARTKGMSNKAFAHIEYTWLKFASTPHFGMGGEVEFGTSDAKCTIDSCDDDECSHCAYVTPSSWGVWLRAGVSF